MTDLDDIFAPAELDPELKKYVTPLGEGFQCLQHPLVYSVPYFEAENKLLNLKLASVKVKIEEAYRKKEFFRYIGWHERPYRLHALSKVADHLTDSDYWQAVREVWIDSENIWQNSTEWLDLWLSERPGRNEHLMQEREAEALSLLPPAIEIYRGFGHNDSKMGMSWTTDLAKAKWFAKRYSNGDTAPTVATTTIDKSEVLAYFLARNESEIVIDPDTLTGKVRIRSLKKING